MSEALPDEWKVALRHWAAKHDDVHQMWLFGSRADGTHRQGSDVDICLVLRPPITQGSTPLGNFSALKCRWRDELIAVVGRHASLEALTHDDPRIATFTAKSKLIWERSG